MLLWFLAVVMGTSLLWLHFGFTENLLPPAAWLVGGTAAGLLWATTRPRWQKTHCSWCGSGVSAEAVKYDDNQKGWILVFECAKCGHLTEKLKSKKV